MSDYSIEADVLRGQMARALANNAEQFFWVVTQAVADVDFEEAMDMAELADDAGPRRCVARLRQMADAIAAGEVL